MEVSEGMDQVIEKEKRVRGKYKLNSHRFSLYRVESQ